LSELQCANKDNNASIFFVPLSITLFLLIFIHLVGRKEKTFASMAWLPAALEQPGAALVLYSHEGSSADHILSIKQGDVVKGSP
jgi:hypothetical protein